MTEANAAPRSEQPLPARDDLGPSWCAVANVVHERSYGPGGAETRRGTKHFAPGAKVYFATAYWGPGGEVATVVGRHRATHRFVTLDMASRHLCDWRTELVYSPHVTRVLAERGEYTSRGPDGRFIGPNRHHPASAEARRHANSLVARFTVASAPAGPFHFPTSGPIPDEAKSFFAAWGPMGPWSPMQPRLGEHPGPREIRFLEDRVGFLRPMPTGGALPDAVPFLWRRTGPDRISLRVLDPGEAIPRPWEVSPFGPGWDEVACEFRLIVTPTAAFEALAETGRDGFWLSPLPVLWAGPPFRLMP